MNMYTVSIAISFDIVYLTKLKRLTTEAITLLKCQNTYDRGLIKSMEEDIKQIDIDLLPFNN